VAELGEEPDLAEEPGRSQDGGVLPLEGLEGEGSTVRGIAPPKHDRHASAADLGFDGVSGGHGAPQLFAQLDGIVVQRDSGAAVARPDASRRRATTEARGGGVPVLLRCGG
jgi:hypothetical protein